MRTFRENDMKTQWKIYKHESRPRQLTTTGVEHLGRETVTIFNIQKKFFSANKSLIILFLISFIEKQSNKITWTQV
jgi:hypothetical protein